ncbi:MAG TPA: hypothetical protein VFX43_21170 [Chitinophagaceae bacterium]|nr:hypothetical protein [Chitinophagaceae bacterium]
MKLPGIFLQKAFEVTGTDKDGYNFSVRTFFEMTYVRMRGGEHPYDRLFIDDSRHIFPISWLIIKYVLKEKADAVFDRGRRCRMAYESMLYQIRSNEHTEIRREVKAFLKLHLDILHHVLSNVVANLIYKLNKILVVCIYYHDFYDYFY